MSTLASKSIPPANGGKPKQLVVFLHGYGSNGDDLIALSPYFAKMLPDAEFISPNALEHDDYGMGYQWFSLAVRTPEKYLSGIKQAGPRLLKYLLEQLKVRGLEEKDMALIGFSQGAMMALHVGARMDQPVAGVVAFSGALIGAELLETEAKSKPPILIVHGEKDDVVPFSSMANAESALEQAGFFVATLSRPALAHSIDDKGISDAVSFLKNHF